MIKRLWCLLCTLVVLVVLPCSMFAQEADSLDYMLQEAVLVSRSVPEKQLSSVPVREIGRETVMRLGMNGVADVLRQMPGVAVHDYGGVGGLKSVSVRGMGAKHTAVMYDGVLVSDAQSGMVDVGRFPIENIDAVSVAMGQGGLGLPRAARDYAFSNVVALRAVDAGRSFVKLQGGAFGLADVSAFGCFEGDDVLRKASLFAGYMRSDGAYPFLLVNANESSWEKRRGGDALSLVLEGNASLALWGGALETKLHYYDSERGLPGAVHLYNKENSERLWNRNFFTQAVYKGVAGDFDVRAALKYDYGFSRYCEKNKNYASGEQVDDNYQNEIYASFAIADCRRWRGVELSLATDASYSTLENNFPNGREPRRLSSYTVLAGNYRWGQGSVSLSLLATYMKDFLASGVPQKAYRRFSPALSLSLRPFADFPLSMRASIKDSYRVPTFADLYYLRLGNVGLRPEKAMQFNVGATWGDSWSAFLKSASFSFDAYYNNVRDKIVALPTMYIWRMMNFGKADIWGADVCADAECGLCTRVSLVANVGYSFQYAVDVTDCAAKNYRHQLPYTPRHSGNFSLSLINPIVNVSYILTAVGERYMLPQNNSSNRMPGYIEHSFSLNHEFLLGGGIKLRLQGDLLNVSDVHYEIIRYYPMPGFSWRASARFFF